MFGITHMRTWLVAAACWLAALCSALAGTEAASQVRLGLQYIEVPKSLVTEILSNDTSGDKSIHTKLMEAVSAGKGRILESAMLLCRNRETAGIESVHQEIFPTEYPGKLVHTNKNGAIETIHPVYRKILAFETGQIGLLLECTPVIVNAEKVSLQLDLAMVSRLRWDTALEYVDRFGDASVRKPIYESWTTQSSLMLRTGKPELISSFSAKPSVPTPLIPMQILVFARAEVLSLK